MRTEQLNTKKKSLNGDVGRFQLLHGARGFTLRACSAVQLNTKMRFKFDFLFIQFRDAMT
jgi:hypothetical protein